MRRIILFLLFSVLTGPLLKGQVNNEKVEGFVSYVTSQNVYVRFHSTGGISEGDTLFMKIDGNITAALKVTGRSSVSCVCVPLISRKFSTADLVFPNKDSKPVEKKPEVSYPVPQPDSEAEPLPLSADTSSVKAAPGRLSNEIIHGRFSVAGYTNLTGAPYGNSFRMRYTLLLNAKNISGSGFSADTYISFSHRNKEWSDIRENLFNGLKIYNLSVNYNFNNRLRITAGRKINPKLSNMGAVDGLQLEFRLRSVTAGLLAGSRPDYSNYGFNHSLFQYGAFASYEPSMKSGNIQTTIAFVEQKNSGITDRRFAYLQHSNTLVRNLTFFGSTEFELYRYKLLTDSLTSPADTVKSVSRAPELSNIYLSFRYRFSGRLSMSLSYSSRKNIIYYETYKSFIDQLMEKETQQGYMLQVNYRPVKLFSVGANGGYRFRKGDPSASKNMYVYATYSRIPLIGISATLSATMLGTSYLNGGILALNLSRDFIRGKLSGGFTYRFTDYTYRGNGYNQMQHSGEISLNWKAIKKLSCALYYEGTYDSRYLLNRIYVQISRNF